MKKLLCLLLILCMLPLTGCSSEANFSVDYEITKIDPESRAVTFKLTVTNEGWLYSISGSSSNLEVTWAKLVSADGKTYTWSAPAFNADVYDFKLWPTESHSGTVTIEGVEESGIYTLSFRLIGVQMEIPDIYIDIPQA